MKTKRLVTVVLFVCVVLFMSHKAQAFYNPSAGRWLSRDPIGENGGENLSGFVHNGPIGIVDLFGLGFGNPVPPINTELPPIGGIPPGPLPPINLPPIGEWPPLPPSNPKPSPPGWPILIPPPPPRTPPSADPGGPADGAAGVADGFSICANMWADISNNSEYLDGIKICKSQMGSQSTSSRCCVMYFCTRNCCGGRKVIKRVSAYLQNSSCSYVRANHAKPGAQLKPGCPEGHSNSKPSYADMWW